MRPTLELPLATGDDGRGRVRLDPQAIPIVMVFALSILLILGSRLISPALGSWNQVLTILTLASFLIVVAYGQGLVILVGGLDLSVPALVTLGGVLTASWVGVGSSDGWYLLPLILLICGLVGICNGIGVVWLKIPPFIMTMASSIILASAVLGYTRGTPRGGSPEVLTDLMRANFFGLRAVIWFMVLFILIAWLVQARSAFGRHLNAVGSNPEAARIAGVPVQRTIVSVYAISAMCGGFAGMMLVGYANGATLRMGDSYLLPSIAAVVIGGSSILGGRGSFLGTVGGAILLTTLGMVISALGIDHGWRRVIEGGIIVLALVLLREQLFDRFRRKPAPRASPA
jgi:ribose transport system permease protein